MLCCAVLLKAIQHLGYFPSLDAVPQPIVQHLRTVLDLDPTTSRSNGRSISMRCRSSFRGS
jgi:hypothetical protein